MKPDPGVSLTVVDGVAHLRLTRPERRNAIDLEMAVALRQALVDCTSLRGVRALLISGDGPDFSVGGDLGQLAKDLVRLPQLAAELAEVIQDAVCRVAELDVPVVCAAGGSAAGAALGLLWGADIAVVADDLKLVTAFAAVGLSGDGGSSWWLPRLAGMRRAQELLLENRRIGAEQALAWGLVTRVVPRAELDGEARRTAEALAQGPTVALGRMRGLLAGGAGQAGLREHLRAETQALAACFQTQDVSEALRAFAERRPPVFTGA